MGMIFSAGSLRSVFGALALSAILASAPAAPGEDAPAPAPRILLDSSGSPLSENLSWLKEELGCKEDSGNLRLTIDSRLQKIAEDELAKMVEDYSPKCAYAIMADPAAGDILAMAALAADGNKDFSLPPNLLFEPGSTMKPVPVSAALDLGLIAPDTEFDCENGSWEYAGKTLKDAHPSGKLTVSEIVKVSSNIGVAKIAVTLGETRLHDAFKSFGFGQKTGLPFKAEEAGTLREVKDWDKLSETRFSIGQGVSCTPLQLVRAYCALANGGTLHPLRLVAGTADQQSGKPAPSPGPAGEKIFRKADTCAKMAAMLKRVTEDGGTGTAGAVAGSSVAGKTGTSQKWTGEEYSATAFIASFIGFAPADKPRYVLLVVADEPQGSHYGGVVAAPTFSRIMQKALAMPE